MMEKLVYLSGAMDGKTLLEANTWRIEAKKLLALANWGSLSPMRGKEHLFEDGRVMYPDQAPDDPMTADSVIVERDLADIDDARVLLVHVGYDPFTRPKPLTGTVCEVFCAKNSYHTKPCVAFKLPGENVHPQVYSPWFGQFFTPRYKVHGSLEDAIEFIVGCF